MSGECDRCGAHAVDCECAPFEWHSDPVTGAMQYFWGERCPDFDDTCDLCQAWAKYDALVADAAKAGA